MKVIEGIGDVKKLIYGNEVTLVAIIDGSTEKSSLIMEIMRSVEEDFRGKIKVVVSKVNALRKGEAAVTLYINGEEIMRQNMFLGDRYRDKELIKWSIREILRNHRARTP